MVQDFFGVILSKNITWLRFLEIIIYGIHLSARGQLNPLLYPQVFYKLNLF